MKHTGIKIEDGKVYHQFEVFRVHQEGMVILSVAPEVEFDSLVGVVDTEDGDHLDVVYADTLEGLAALAAEY